MNVSYEHGENAKLRAHKEIQQKVNAVEFDRVSIESYHSIMMAD